MYWSTTWTTRMRRTGRAPSSTSTITSSPGPRVQQLGERHGEHEPLLRQRDGAVPRVDQAVQARLGDQALDGGLAREVAVAQARRHGAERLGVGHAGEPRQLVERPGRGRLGEGDRRVLALDHGELLVHEDLDRVARATLPMMTSEQPAAMPPTAISGAQRPAGEVAQDHPRRRREEAAEAEPLQQGLAVVGRRLGAHGLGRRQGRDPPHRARARRPEPRPGPRPRPGRRGTGRGRSAAPGSWNISVYSFVTSTPARPRPAVPIRLPAAAMIRPSFA